VDTSTLATKKVPGATPRTSAPKRGATPLRIARPEISRIPAQAKLNPGRRPRVREAAPLGVDSSHPGADTGWPQWAQNGSRVKHGWPQPGQNPPGGDGLGVGKTTAAGPGEGTGAGG
jgi:hypothetical protein